VKIDTEVIFLFGRFHISRDNIKFICGFVVQTFGDFVRYHGNRGGRGRGPGGRMRGGYYGRGGYGYSGRGRGRGSGGGAMPGRAL